MHHINQLQPKGADKDYANALFNCGPAVVAMLARGHGKMGDLNDAQLIQELGKGIVTEKGSTPEGIAQMMERADIPLAGDALGAGYTEQDVQDHLKQGHKMIAQVRSTNSKSLQDSAHYVVVEGMTRDGNYVISDPLAKGPYAVKPEQLKEAVLKAPPDGGMLIPVAAPGEEIKPTAPAAGTAPTAVTPAGTPTPAPAAIAARPADGFSDPDLRAIEARRVTDPHGLRVADILAGAGNTAPVDPSRVAVAGRVSNPFGIPVAGLTTGSSRAVAPALEQALGAETGVARAVDGSLRPGVNEVGTGYDLPQLAFGPKPAVAQPAVAPAPAAPADTAGSTTAPLIVDEPVKVVSEDKAFAVADAELAKVDGEFKEIDDEPSDSRFRENERRNKFDFDIDYGGSDGKHGKHGDSKRVSDDKMSVGDFVRHLLGLKKRGDSKAYDLLGQLEHSKHAKDKQVLKEIEESDKKDPGSGSRRWGDMF